MNTIKKNLGLQTVYQVVSACLPLITAPYLSRKLGAAQLGVFSYTTSIVMYFSLVAMLGTVNYGTRSIASVKNDRRERNGVFSSIYAFQVMASIGVIILYVIYLQFICTDNKNIAFLQGISLISCLVDINWLFFGVEDFQITVTRSIFIRITTVILILIFVKNETDLWIYTIIMLVGTLISNIVLFFYLPRYATFSKVTKEQIIKHIKPNLILFLPLLAMTVYHTMDKTMLGAMSTYEESGFYYNSDKLVQIPLLIFNGIGTVMLPRMSALFTEKKQEEANLLFIKTLEGVAVISIAIASGIAAVSKEFIPLFFGNGYEPCIILTIVFTPILLFKGISVIIRTQYLIPMQLEKEFTKSVLGGALVNLVLNIFLIPMYGALGAVIATVIAEFAACILQIYSLKNRQLQLKRLVIKTGIYILFGLIMIGVVRVVSLWNTHNMIKLLAEIFVGAVFYIMLCTIYWIRTKNFLYYSIKSVLKNKKMNR